MKKKSKEKNITMHDLYGDGSKHLACKKCGCCLTCKDCLCLKDRKKIGVDLH